MSLDKLYYAMDCGLKTVEQALTDNNLPVPETSKVIPRDPSDESDDNTCRCNSLYVYPGDSFNSSDDPCGFPITEITIHIALFRDVCVASPFDTNCPDKAPDLDKCDPIADSLPDGECGQYAPNENIETRWLLQERMLLESKIPAGWSKCLCEPVCGQMVSSSKVTWVSSTMPDSGGCAGTIAEYTLRFP